MNWYIGQRIVAIKNHSLGIYKKGDEFRIVSIRDGICPCATTLLDIGIRDMGAISWCFKCNVGMPNSNSIWFIDKSFVPLDTTESEYTAEQLINEIEVCESESENIGVPIYAPEYG